MYEENGISNIICLYSRFDMMILERIVGSGKAGEMVKEYCNSVSFIV